MFQDEARFGRINEPRRCWAASNCRPLVKKQIVREYTYVYGAVSPKDGISDFLILPAMDALCMNLFLQEIGLRHKGEFLLLIYDGAPCHSPGALDMPSNMMVETLPPYSPELNPVENIWEEIREKSFENVVFDSMEAVENRLIEAVMRLETHPEIVKSITGFNWILHHLLNAN
jgi:hypothetical protein